MTHTHIAMGAQQSPSRLRRLQSRLELLGSAGEALSRCTTQEELFRSAYRLASQLLDTTGFIVGLYDAPSQTVTVAYQVESGTELPGGSFPLGSGFVSEAIRGGQPQLIRKWSSQGPRVQVQYATGHAGLPESGITVPLKAGGNVIGVLSVQSYRPGAYADADLWALSIIAGQVSLVLENLRKASFDQQLHHRLSDLEAILSEMSEALLIVDSEGCIVRLNRAARELLCPEGGCNAVVLGQPIASERSGVWSLGKRGLGEALLPVVDALKHGKAVTDLEVELKGPGRQVFSFSCAPRRDSSGSPSGGVIIFRDVTSRRDLERMKDEILSIASHDLKTPVTVIKGQAQLLLRSLSANRATPERLSEGLTGIVQQSDRLVGLLDLLLDFSRIEAGRFQITRSPADLVAVVQSMVETIQIATDRHQISLHAPERVEGNWDVPRLGQVLQNLLINAVKYSPEGGRVEVTVEPGETSVTVSVRDQGVGIPPGEAGRLFERFYRVEGTRKLEGAGLGLYIAEAIVDAHGGRIWAESPGLGLGSTFRFTLPL